MLQDAVQFQSAPALLPDTAAQVGAIDVAQLPAASRYSTSLLQIAHKQQSPTCNEPAFRILGMARNAREHAAFVARAQEQLQGRGNIFAHSEGSATLLCKSMERQVDATYVTPRLAELQQQQLDFKHKLDDEYETSRQAKKDGNIETAQLLADEMVAEHNERGWVKMMRDRTGIKPDAMVLPGQHQVTEQDREQLFSGSTPLTFKGDPGEAALPDGLRVKQQQFAAISFVVSDDEDMEVALWIYGVFETLEAAKQAAQHHIAPQTPVMSVHVVDVGEWIYPVQMLWVDPETAEGTAVATNFERVFTDPQIQRINDDRRRQYKQSLEQMHEIKNKQSRPIDPGARDELSVRLGITVEQFDALAASDGGSDTIVRLASIDGVTKRAAAAAAAVANLGE